MDRIFKSYITTSITCLDEETVKGGMRNGMEHGMGIRNETLNSSV